MARPGTRIARTAHRTHTARRVCASALALLLTGFGLIALASPAQAADTANYYVSSVEGTDAGGCIDPDQPCQTIQFAATMALVSMIPADKDATVHIAAGTYPENITIGNIPEGSSLTLTGADQTTTIVDGGVNGTTVQIASGAVVINQLTITGGFSNASTGAGIHAGSGSTVRVTDSTISHNHAAGAGGGIRADEGSTVEVDDSTIRHNSATFGGGVSAADQSEVTINNSAIISNWAAEGAGIDAQNHSKVWVTGSTISQNTAEKDPDNPLIVSGNGGIGGGIRLVSAQVHVVDTTLDGNSAEGMGGGIHSAGQLELRGSTLSGNSAPSGGGISAVWQTTNVTNSTLSGNFTVPIDLGPGSFAVGADSVVTVTASTIVGGNIKGNGQLTVDTSIMFGLNCSGVIDGGYNVASDGNCVSSGTGSRSTTTEDIALKPLAENYSPGPLTHAIPARGPSFFFVPANRCQATDQRGEVRIRSGSTHCDAGAFERLLGYGTDLYVYEQEGRDSGSCGVFEPCRTIGRALERAAEEIWAGAPALEIHLISGTFQENLELRVHYGATLTLSGGGAGRAVIDGTGSGPVIKHFEGAVVLSGLTVTGGNAELVGGGVYSTSLDGITITDSAIVGNTAHAVSGVFGANLTMTGSTVSGNTAGLRIAVAGLDANISNSTIRDNGPDEVGRVSIERGSIVSSTIVGGDLSSNDSLTVTGSILADVECRGVIEGNYNVVSKTSCAQGGAGNAVRSVDDIGLSPLTLSGNVGTETSAISLFSSARTIVPGAYCPETDQRGELRLAAYHDAPYCDAGAYERQPDDPRGLLPRSLPLETVSDPDTFVRVLQEPSGALTPLQNVTLELFGFAPFSDATLVMFSSPVVLGQVTMDGNGNATTTVTLPEGVTGTHTIVAAGSNFDRQAIFPRQTVTIRAAAVSGGALAATGAPRSTPGIVGTGILLIVVGSILSIAAIGIRLRRNA